MGCQHSAPVPTAEDFNYLPPGNLPRGMNDKVLPIESPGMCYGLKLKLQEHQQQQQQKERTNSSTNSTKNTNSKEHHKCQIMVDDQAGNSFFGLQIIRCCEPSKNGKLLLLAKEEQGHSSIVAIMQPRVRGRSRPSKTEKHEVFYDILCPPKNNGSNNVSKRQEQQQQQQHDCWDVWATVRSVPHSLQFELVQTSSSSSTTTSTTSSATSLILDYCGPVVGPCQMRIDDNHNHNHNHNHNTNGTIPHPQHADPPHSRALIIQTPSSWNVVIGPGVDPCIILCFVAIVNQQSHGSRISHQKRGRRRALR